MKLTFYMGIWNEYSIFCVIKDFLPSSFNSTQIKAKNLRVANAFKRELATIIRWAK
jgi:hypothetical protein